MFTELDTLSEESYKDSTLIMQLLRDNLVCTTLPSLAGFYVLTWSRPSGLLPTPRPRPLHRTPPPRPPPRRPRRTRPQSLLPRSPRLPSKGDARVLPFLYRDRTGLPWLIPPRGVVGVWFSKKSTANEAWFTQTQIHQRTDDFARHPRPGLSGILRFLVSPIAPDLDSTAEETEIVWTIHLTLLF